MNKLLIILLLFFTITVSSQEVKYFTDYRDSQTYKAVKIGTQWWMGENLNYEVDGSYCYDNSSSNCDTYGRLYLWEAAMGHDLVEGTQGVCPNGWHLPTDAEWTTLTTFLGGTGVAGGKLKEVGTTHWTTPNTGATDEVGFTTLPGGYRLSNGGFYGMGYDAYFWSSTENGASDAWNRGLACDFADVYRGYANKDYGRSVRCLKDEPFNKKPSAPILKVDFRDASLIDKVSGTSGTLTIGSGGFIKVEKGISLESDGATTNLSYSAHDMTGDKTCEIWFYAKSMGEGNAGHLLSDEDYFNIYLVSNTVKISRNGSTSATSATISLNTWYHLVITSTDAGVSNIYLNGSLSGTANQSAGTPQYINKALHVGNRLSGDRSFDGYISKVVVWDNILTSGERAALYTEYLRSRPKSNTYKFHLQDTTIYKIEDFKNEYADGSTVIPEGWVQGTGSYKIGETATPILSDYHKGTKYLECISAGTMAFPSNQAYGTWEFDVYKGANGNNTEVGIISSNNQLQLEGYQLLLHDNESIRLYEYNSSGFSGSLLEAVDSYIFNNTWYRIKVERTSAEQFSVYIKGGTFGNTYTLVSTTGGSGTNPVTDNTYTESNYFVIDLDVGDRIANIKITD